jgi:DNA polymerase III epsilon subunit-like protein
MAGKRAALAFLDTETTSLDEENGRIWEIGLILRGPGQDEDLQMVVQIDGVRAEEFEPKARQVSRFDERYGKDAALMGAGTAVHALTSWLAGRHLVGANPAFDQAFLKSMFRAYRLEPTWHHRLIDVEALAMQSLGIPTPMGLRQSADALGIRYDPDSLHSAFGDAELAMRIYDLVVHGKEQGRN